MRRLFQMPNNERIYDESKSVITFLSPYEDNTKALQEKKKSKNCVSGKNRILKLKILSGDFKPYAVKEKKN